jgi:macrolide transport system ATP-binding/permease protein
MDARDRCHRERAEPRMIVLYRIRAFVRWLLRRDEIERALESDLADYVERSIEEKIRNGMPAAEARRAALIEIGGLEQAKERVRETLAFRPLDSLVRDTRYALRTMGRQKTFTVLAVLCLALGIGANTTIYSFMDSILFRALPVEEPGELVILQWTARRPADGVPWAMPTNGRLVGVDAGLRSDSWPYPVFELFRERRELFADVFGNAPASQLTIDDGAQPPADGLYVTGNFFASLGIDARAGRLLTAADDRFDAPPAAVLSSAFGTELFGSAEAAVGRQIRLSGVAFTVVGVAPASFFGIDSERPPSFYLPMRAGPLIVAANPRVVLAGGESRLAAALIGNNVEMYQSPRFYWVSTWARLRPGVAREQVEAALRPRFEQFFADNVSDSDALRNTPQLQVAAGTGGLDGMRTRYRETLLILFGMVVLILAVACASIASLLLGRAMTRRREMAVRMSLGAGRLGVVRQLLTESILLAMIGGVAGVALSIAGMRLLAALLAAGFDATLFRAELNWPVLAFTLGVTLLTGVLFGVAPAIHAANVAIFPALKGSRSKPDAETPRGRHRIAFGQMLVVAQIALSLVLLVGASLFAATLANLRTTELGFNQQRLLLANVDATRAGYDADGVKSFWRSLHERLRQVPGVESASLSWSVLAGGGAYVRSATAPSASVQSADINVQVVGPAFFETMQIDILAGRSIGDWEVESGEAVAVVDRSFADMFFQGTDPVGRTIDVQDEGELRIVGVSANARHDRIRGDVRPVVYYSYKWDPHALFGMTVELRTQGEPLGYVAALRTVVRDLDPQVTVSAVRTQAANTDQTISREILFARLSNAFAVLALVIACAGIYGTVSYRLARQTAELGIRMALGATRARILRLALRQVLGLGLTGLAIGLAAALFASRYIETLLWGIGPNDPAILVGAALAVLAVVVLAAYAPASRASSIDPMAALRSE